MSVRPLTADHLADWRQAVADAASLAIDTEFHAERRYVPQLFLVQIGLPTGDAWIVDPLTTDVLAAIREDLLRRPWIVHGGAQDLLLLTRALGGAPDVALDTQIAAGWLTERYPLGYGALVAEHIGVQLSKSATLSDWSRRPLSHEQLQYAAEDVLRLHGLWSSLAAKLTAAGRLDAAHAACAEARDRSIHLPDPNEAWRSFAAAESMDATARGLLLALAAWRERRAQADDQPPRAILGDGGVVERAKRPPANEAGIVANRRFPRPAHRWVPELAAVIRDQRAAPHPAPRTPERWTRPWRDRMFLQAWLADWCFDHRIAGALILPPATLDALCTDPPASRAALSSTLGWRDPFIGEALWTALRDRMGVLTGVTKKDCQS